jgi:adenosine deaminase
MSINDVLTKPKAEIHIHLEGSLEPRTLIKLARRNNINIKYKTVEDVQKAYKFSNLQEFLEIYYQGMSVLITEQDYYDLAFEYFTNANNDNITHIECFIDPQAHMERGIPLKTVFAGLDRAIVDAKLQFNITVNTIVCFLRHLGQDPALRAFDSVMEHRQSFIGIGLDSSELGFPPSMFKELYRKAEKEKLFLVAHAGEEGPVDYVWEAIDILGVNRIDHGNIIIKDNDLIGRVIKDDLAITMCPLSNKCGALH